MAEVLQYPRDFFVWMDETGADGRDQIRRFGYTLRGVEPVYHRFLYRGTRITALAAISSDGVIDHEMVKGSVNGELFCDFVVGNLIPNMLPFPNKNSILVMDNCSIHHVQYIKDILEFAGILVLFLPPYSPDFNPIENVFGNVKSYLKTHDEVIQSAKAIFSSAFNDITTNQCNAWITNSGYSIL